MDTSSQPQTAGVNKTSGIPRLSKLPQPKTRTADAPLPPLVRPEVSKPVRPAESTPRLQKRASIASFSRSTSSLARESVLPAKPEAARTGNQNGTKRVSSHGVRPTSISSRVNLQRQPSSSVKASTTGEDEENHDRLTSLDSFRSASRQGSREGPPLETPDDVDNFEPSPMPRLRKVSRPSLSDRTVESLQTIPSTPKDRRRSGFFNQTVSPMGPPPRPSSSLSRQESIGSRPGTSDGTFARAISRPTSPEKRAPASAIPSSRTTHAGFGLGRNAGGSRGVSTNLTSKLQDARSKAASPIKPAPTQLSNGEAAKASIGKRPPKTSTRAPALGEAFVPAKKATSKPNTAETPNEPKRVVSNSSAALREQIAAAKAAARKDRTMNDSPHDSVISSHQMNSVETEFHADPLNQAPKDEAHMLRNRINVARMDGKLNIAAMSLTRIPDEVRSMYSAASMEESRVDWSEVVDLTKFIAADNDLEAFDDAVFPDKSADDFAADELSEGNQFGGLEVLDLHGNALRALPLGLRRLERLTSLDLAHNKLDNSALDVISQIQSLKELKLGHNALTGNLSSSVCKLPHLEVLDVQANRLLGLPEALRELVSLRVLNASGNQLTTLPMEALQQLPLSELDASSNALIASLFPLGGVTGHSTLQILNVANNSLAALTFSELLDLPQLRTLNVTNNQMALLPSVSGWTDLHSLAAGENKISDFPIGFTSLQKLRRVNFTSNEIRVLDPEICRMTSLESLILAANPLREKKFLTMDAADMKRELRTRLAPAGADEASTDEDPGSPVTVIGSQDAAASIWMLKANGLLDLASRNLSDDINDQLGSCLNDSEVRQLRLQSNEITCIPPALWLGQDLRILDLSDNVLSSDYLSDELSLPCLQELNLSRCRLASLEPLVSQLIAPKLRHLNVTANRLSGSLPTLRATYPTLSTLLASDNRFDSISAEALQGMQAVNLKSNDIHQLPAEVGLLWDEGLRDLDVSSNAFRVPNYRVLEKGTDAVLKWLRDRLPAEPGAEEVD